MDGCNGYTTVLFFLIMTLTAPMVLGQNSTCHKVIAADELMATCQSNYSMYDGRQVEVLKFDNTATSIVPVRIRKVRRIDLTCDTSLLLDTTLSVRYKNYLTDQAVCNGSYHYPIRKCLWPFLRTTSGYEVEDEKVTAVYDWMTGTYRIPTISNYWTHEMGTIDHRVVCIDLSPSFVCTIPVLMKCTLLTKVEKNRTYTDLICPSEGEMYRISSEVTDHHCTEIKLYLTEAGGVIGGNLGKVHLSGQRSQITSRVRMLTHLVEEEAYIREDEQCRRFRKGLKQHMTASDIDCGIFGYLGYKCDVGPTGISVNYPCNRTAPERFLTNASYPDEILNLRAARLISSEDPTDSDGEVRTQSLFHSFWESIKAVYTWTVVALFVALFASILSIGIRMRTLLSGRTPVREEIPLPATQPLASEQSSHYY